ncbi:MAG: polysaccharide biosynthesis tyrosine autokinase [Cyanobacteriota bacterium]|nr:polysaccharide biosynthesis tyrosine autokinase [Cyanobacteriota bacterium]
MLLQAIAEREKTSARTLAALIDINSPDKEASDLVQVKLRWPDPVKGQQILEDLARTYISYSTDQRMAALDSGIKFLDRQAPDLQSRMEILQNQLKRFRESNNFLEPQQQGTAIQTARDSLTQQLRALQVQQAELESQLGSVRDGRLKAIESFITPAQQALGNTTLATAPRAPGASPGGSTPFQDLLQVEKELSTARATFTNDAPIVRTLQARRDQLFPVVQKQASDAINSRLLSNTAQQNELNRQILELNSNFLSSPSKIKEYEDLQQRLSVARENFASYIKARETYRLEMARVTTPWQIIAPPEFSGDPVLPDIPRSFLLALGVGFATALAAAWIRERTDNLFHSPQEVGQSVQMPVLGLIPFLPLDPSLSVARSIERLSPGERFAIKESLRSLFTTFRMLSADQSLRLVGITSTSQGEGKSFSVTIFARTLADLGMKVLVVDADMRLPTQTRYMGAEPADGFSKLLSDSTVAARDLIRPVHDNLDLLPAGQKAPDPARLLNSARCTEVIKEIRGLSDYDLILFDAPPCLMLADPILLGEKLDGMMFLVGLGVISKEVVNQAIRRVRSSGVDLLGVICNQVSFPTRLNDYGYEYGYYYHYSYTSGYADASSSPGYAARYVKDAITTNGQQNQPADGAQGNGQRSKTGLGALIGQRKPKDLKDNTPN